MKLVRAKHGTRSGYTAGCRCPKCSKANRDYQREWMRAHYVPTGNPVGRPRGSRSVNVPRDGF